MHSLSLVFKKPSWNMIRITLFVKTVEKIAADLCSLTEQECTCAGLLVQ